MANFEYAPVGGNEGMIPHGTTIKTTLDGTAHIQHVNVETSSDARLFVDTNGGHLSTDNSVTSYAIGAGETWEGTFENVMDYAGGRIQVYSTEASATNGLTLYVSPDGTTDNEIADDSFAIPADTLKTFASTTGAWFRITYTNGATPATLTIITTYKKGLSVVSSHRIADNITPQDDAQLTQSVLKAQKPNQDFVNIDATAGGNLKVAIEEAEASVGYQLRGYTDGGTLVNAPLTAEGHLEVSLQSPRLPFGSIHTENLVAVFQSDGVYAANDSLNDITTSGSGTAGTTDSAFFVSTGTTAFSQSVIQSRKRLRYRAGQGAVGKFTAVFSTPVAYSYQLAGMGHSEDGLYFGYGNTTDLTDTRFGILYVNRGVREIQTLTVTAGATSAGNVIITLNSVPFTVAVTNSSNIQRTVYEIAQGNYEGWKAEPRGDAVIFIANSAGDKTGTFSFAAGATGSAASIVETIAGAASNDLFIPQSTWNGDVMDGSGSSDNPSGYNLNPQAGNVYQINVQYLGFGAITFQIEGIPEGRNNPDFVTVHTLKIPNTRTTTSLGNPSFPITMAAYSAGSTDDVTVKVGSYGGFIEGAKRLHGARMSYYNSTGSITSAAYYPLFSILNSRYYSGRANQAVVNLQSMSGACKHNNPVVYYLIRNGTLTGNPNFQQFSTKSCTYWDTAATGVTFADNGQVVWSGHLGETGDLDHLFDTVGEDVTLQPGEMWTLAARSLGAGSPTFVTGSLNTREDQ